MELWECINCGAPGGYRYCSTACEVADACPDGPDCRTCPDAEKEVR
ncbi:hypothetical protein HEB29_005959 [Streptomyces fulvorobeus]|uniref:Uncharacterized protein n=1 Tax=Streptomyces fulvorobeus TaxID=284028 RepID=A0A7Y9KZT9_9ACTN|nr:hypothetical protein [Streptomyces fulvorobeus]